MQGSWGWPGGCFAGGVSWTNIQILKGNQYANCLVLITVSIEISVLWDGCGRCMAKQITGNIIRETKMDANSSENFMMITSWFRRV